MKRLDPAQNPIVAFLAILGSIVLLVLAGLIAARTGVTKDEMALILAFVGTPVGALIGVIGTFRPKAVAPIEADKPAPDGDT